MKTYKITLRNPAGDTRIVEMQHDDPDLLVWWWTDGNGACDCNRAIYMARVDDPKAYSEANNFFDVPCGHTYSLERIEGPDGEVLYNFVRFKKGFD
jgi:hypothetical protein